MSDLTLLTLGTAISFIVVAGVYTYAREGFMRIAAQEKRPLVHRGEAMQRKADGRHAA